MNERIDFKGGFFHIAAPALNTELGSEWDVWFNAELDFDGVCIGSGATREIALADARDTLESAIAKLTLDARRAK